MKGRIEEKGVESDPAGRKGQGESKEVEGRRRKKEGEQVNRPWWTEQAGAIQPVKLARFLGG
jgi:hypothetical protein